MAFNPDDYSLLSAEEMSGIRPGGAGLQVETCTGANCGDALANFLNSGPLKDTGVALPRGGIGPGDLASVGKARGAAVYGRENLSLETLTPGTVIHLTRQPGDRNYEYGDTHIGIVDTDADGNKVFKSFTAGKGWRTEAVDQNFLAQLPAKITATNPVNPESGGVWAAVGNWLGPKAAEAAGLPGGGVRPGFNPADYSVRPGFNPGDYSPMEAGFNPPQLPSRDEFMEAVQGADVGAGLYQPPRPGPRPPGIYQEERGLVESVKDYLGYKELPAFLPAFNKETGLWQAQDIYEARKLYHGWDDHSELDRVIYHGLISPLTLGLTDYFAKELTAPVPAPETMTGAVAAGALGLGAFFESPYKLATGLLGTRLEPTRTGLRGLAQIMAHGGATLGLATSLSALFPSLAHNDRWTDAGLEFVNSAASGTTIGLLFPLAGAVPTRTMRLAAGLAALDFVKTRFHAAPDQGYFTLDDVYRGVKDGSIDRTVLAQKTFDYLLDLYFLAKTPSMRKQLEGLRMNALTAEAAKASPQEAEDALVAIGKSGTLKEGFNYQGSGVRGLGLEEGVRAGTPAPPTPEGPPGLRPGEGDPGRPGRNPAALKVWELTLDEYGARVRALTPEDRPEPSAAKIAKRREQDVAHALKRGEPVPPEVLADYPELAKQFGKDLPELEVEPQGEAAKAKEGRDPFQEAVDKQRGLLKAVEAKLGRARSDKSKEKLGLERSTILEEISRLEQAKIQDEANQESLRQDLAAKEAAPEPPDYAFIETGDLIQDAGDPRVWGYVLREAAKEGKPGFVVDQEGRERFIGREESRVMGLEEQEKQGVRGEQGSGVRGHESGAEAGETPALQKMYGGGPGVEEVQEFGRQLAGLGKRLIDGIDKRLEKNMPPELQDPDASKIIGSLLLRFQQFEDIGRTYPEARKTFEAARAGLALKTRHAAEFYQLTAPYLSRLNPEQRGRVDKALVELDRINDPEMERHFRLGNDIDRWQSYLLNPREDIRDKGVEFFMSRGLSEPEAEGAFGVRMSLDYAKALHLDWHTRSVQEWLESQGFDRARVKDIMNHLLFTESKPEEIAKGIFGADVGPNTIATLERFRATMQYWLKETNQYIPHARFGDYFLRVIDTVAAKRTRAAYKLKLEAIDRRYPQEKVDVEETLKQGALEFMEAAEEAPPREAPRKKLTKADRLREAAREEFQEAMRATVIHATAAESRAQYHDKRAALEAEFPAESGFIIKESLNKQLPMEIFAETHIPRVWKIVSEAANSGKMPEGSKAAMVEAWQDFLAAKGFGAHFIKRSNTPGYETDLVRPLTGYLSGLAGYIGKMEKIRGFSEAFQEVPRTMPNLLRHLNEYSNYVLSNPNELESVRKVIYHWTLGGNISFHFINALQNLNVGWAVLGTAQGAGPGPGRQLAGAMKDWGRYMISGEGLRPGEEAALARARFEPELAPSGVGELSGQAYNPLHRWLHNDPTTLTAKAMDVFKGFWGGAFVEQMNRESFWLAAFRRTGDYDQAVELVRGAHFLYGKETRPAVVRGPLGSMMGIFLTYTTNYFTLLKNFSKAALGVHPEVYGSREVGAKALSRMFAGALMTGGLLATGLWPVINYAWEKVFGSNIEEDGKDYLQETLGVSRGTAERMERGVQRGLLASALGIDIGSRIAPNLPMTNLPSGDLSWQNMVGAALGAGSIPLQTAWSVGRALSEGDPRRALEAGAPVSVRNLLAAVRLSTQGATTLKGAPIFTAQGEPLKLTPGEAVKKGLGFQPVRLAEHYSQAGHARRMEEDRRDRAQGFAGDLARAIRNQDEAGFQRTIEAWVAYNNKMLAAKRYADVIQPQSVMSGVKSRFKPTYPDVSEKQMRLRNLGRESLADTLSPEEMSE